MQISFNLFLIKISDNSKNSLIDPGTYILAAIVRNRALIVIMKS